MKILVVISQFNSDVVSSIEQDVVRCMQKYNSVLYDILHVPGAFEIPCAIEMAIASGKNYDGYVALGCVVRGSTSHYEIISKEVACSISKMIIKHVLPIGYGIINAENLAQAMSRVGPNSRNNYTEAAIFATVEMIKVKAQLFNNG